MSKNVRKLFIAIVVAIIVFLVCFLRESPFESFDKIEEMRKIVEENMNQGRIPGMAICVIDEEGEYTECFGYADLKKRIAVKKETMFQLGSVSKSFTAYAVGQLIEQGVIQETDYISKYIPEFYMVYKGRYKGVDLNQRVDITIEQLFHHTSGIPASTLVAIEESESPEALEKCVFSIMGTELNNYPGEKFEYATMNYDILGRIIEVASGMSYEEYMKKNVFSQLALYNTTADTNCYVAKGYKQGLFRVEEYNAPTYKGNVPAGYIQSNIQDMSKWLKIQLNSKELDEETSKIVNNNHIANRKNTTDKKDSFYCKGWYEKDTIDGKFFSHGGKNPNFSSHILYNIEEKIGICVLANMSSAYVEAIANDIMNYYTGNENAEPVKDTAKILNTISLFIISFLIPFIVANIVFIVKLLLDIKKKRVDFSGFSKGKERIVIMIFITLICTTLIAKLPSLLFKGGNWIFAQVWMPSSLIIAAVLVEAGVILYMIYYLLNISIIGGFKTIIYILLVLSIISGLGNASVIFTINSAVAQGNYFDKELFVFFFLSLSLYILGQRIVRFDLLEITNNIILIKRKELISLILNTDYETFEKIESGQIQSCLNNDTEVISGFSNTFITAVTCLTTIICCFCYMYIANIYGFLITLAVVFIAVILYMSVNQQAKESWEKARSCQNVFFKRITDLLSGFKELSISWIKKKAFLEDINATCEEYKIKSQEGEFKYAGVFIIGESVFTAVIGTIVFLFPLIFINQRNVNIREYVFILLYITGPINGVLNAIPNLMRVKISWERIRALTRRLLKAAKNKKSSKALQSISDSFQTLSVVELMFKYSEDNEEGFQIGPGSATFHKGQISFIIGGNGSGKSTFMKLLTGLYSPTGGCILVNQEKCETLGELFSTVYSDYYLFEKLYGMDVDEKSEIVLKYMKMLELEEKVKLFKNEFSTIRLSSGQRKRLALLLAYLEDRPVFIFDEWAADQDPGYREIFYHEILPDLKRKGKCVIAITHDDRYFNVADQLLRMESGQFIHV